MPAADAKGPSFGEGIRALPGAHGWTFCSVTGAIVPSRPRAWWNSVRDFPSLLHEELIHAQGERLNFCFGADVDLVVEFAAHAVLRVLAVLAHHDDRGLHGGEHREEQIEQDEGVRVPGAVLEGDVDPGVADEDRCRRR